LNSFALLAFKRYPLPVDPALTSSSWNDASNAPKLADQEGQPTLFADLK
jgi:hypothetical protein